MKKRKLKTKYKAKGINVTISPRAHKKIEGRRKAASPERTMREQVNADNSLEINE